MADNGYLMLKSNNKSTADPEKQPAVFVVAPYCNRKNIRLPKTLIFQNPHIQGWHFFLYFFFGVRVGCGGVWRCLKMWQPLAGSRPMRSNAIILRG